MDCWDLLPRVVMVGFLGSLGPGSLGWGWGPWNVGQQQPCFTLGVRFLGQLGVAWWFTWTAQWG